jgi:hypothetical protein
VLAKFLEALQGDLGNRWSAALLAPATAFWGAGLLLWAMEGRGLAALAAGFLALPAAVQLALVVAALALVAVSTALAERAALPLLTWLEGYWPDLLVTGRLGGPWRRLRGRHARRQAAARARLEALEGKGLDRLTAEEAWQHVALDLELQRLPSDPNDLMPTRLGNILRAGERKPFQKYGLDGIVCWPRLWLLLPDGTRQELAWARQALDASLRWVVWGLAFCLWAPLAWWAPAVGLAGALLAYHAALRPAAVYADLIEAAYDVHRGLLYGACRWPLPARTAEEPAAGQALTLYLVRGRTADRAGAPLEPLKD